MKYKVGDKVRIKSLDWCNQMLAIKDKQAYRTASNGCEFIGFWCGNRIFKNDMIKFCGQVMTIKAIENEYYVMHEDTSGYWYCDEMIEELVEDDVDWIPKFGEYSDNEHLDISTMTTDFVKDHGLPCPNGYIFKDENGNEILTSKIILEKKKKEYPKTYEECCKIMQVARPTIWFDYDDVSSISKEGDEYEHHIENTLCAFRRLLICRDAYWKIAGEEMGLGKPWKPDWENKEEEKYTIEYFAGMVFKDHSSSCSRPFAFPTPEMRDAFMENFDPDIEFCKGLL